MFEPQQNFTSSSLGAIIVNPVDSDAASNSVQAADKAKIPVIAVDRGVNKAVRTPSWPPTRSRAASWPRGPSPRSWAANQVVAQPPAGFDRTKGLDVMSNLLQAHPDVQGVIAADHETVLGATKALGSKAGESVQVVGFDGTRDGLKAVQGGTLCASVAQQPSQLGRIAVDDALKALRAKKVEETVKVPVKVVTQRNAAGFSG